MRLTRVTLAVLLLVAVTATTGVAWGRSEKSGQGMSPSQAEQEARRQTGGGRVLSVKPSDGGYQVKVLTPSGEVKYVFVSGR
ncbi:PepSY domain-containing protein [Thiocapsa rosea]|uniref:YpeB-like protein with putative protease inhibitory function n=1 Tax=Thiocapsa rosea TaxID=69360 RepID=A0A495VBN8_9GAMM|nr:PepSY domain-containing protein [Thiocapsa rosea]RKT45787.1 YpeB-like protein with putative protease inhibitory function [Thiocapsa rosea]